MRVCLFCKFFSLMYHTYLDLWVFFCRKMWEKFYFVIFIFFKAQSWSGELESVLGKLSGFLLFSSNGTHTHIWEMMCVRSNITLKWFHRVLDTLGHTIPSHGRLPVYSRVLGGALGISPRGAPPPPPIFVTKSSLLVSLCVESHSELW